MFVAAYLLALFTLTFSRGTTAQLKKSISNETPKSSCLNGLIHEVDKIVYSINTSDDMLSYEILGNHSKIQLCQIEMYNITCSEELTQSACYCRSNQSSILEIVLKITANMEYSEKLLNVGWNLTGNGSINDNVSVTLPHIYLKDITELSLNGDEWSLESCNFTVVSDVVIKWCVRNLGNHTVTIASGNILKSSDSECVTYTIPSDTLLRNIAFSYQEIDGCLRNETYMCIIKVEEPDIKSCPDDCQDVVVTHVIITVIVLLLSVISVISIINEKDNPMNILLLLLALLVVAQFILVIIAATNVEYNGKTTIHIWKIMMIYQCLIYLIFLCIEAVIITIKTKLNIYSLISTPWIYLLILICIHSAVGVVAVPCLIKYIVKENSADDIQLKKITRTRSR